MLSLKVNGNVFSANVEAETPLLWVIRDTIGLTGTKYGCGVGMCGACTVHVNGKAVRSCMTKVSQVVGQEVTTIEGLGGTHPVQEAWREGDVPECGYCQPGQIMAAGALLGKKTHPPDTDTTGEITNLFRCGTDFRVRESVYPAGQWSSRG